MDQTPNARSPSSSLHVLVVDDDPLCQKLATALLKKKGHSTTLAVNGREAVKLAEIETFDLILMDIMMPEMDGLEATRIIRDREKETGRYVPIVAVTAGSTERETCLAAGMDEFMPKPIRSAQLTAMIELVIGLPQVGTE
jgi:CheY-like chemotaxis protein